MALQAEEVVRLALPILSAAFMVGFAALLLALDFNRVVHRAFALFLIVRAASSSLAVMRGTVLPDQVAQALFGYFLIPVVPLLLYLPCVYPKRRTWFGTSPLGGWVLLACIVALEALYAWDHGLLWTWQASHEFGAFSTAGRGLEYVQYGPLQLLTGLLYPSYGIVAFILARDYVRSGEHSTSLLLVLAGFLLNGLFDSAGRALELGSLLSSGEPYAWAPWGWARAVLPALTVLPCLAAVIVLARAARRLELAKARKVRGLVWFCAVPPTTAVAATLLTGTGIEAASVPASVLLGLWRLALPSLVTYALLRYRLFDIDAKVRIVITDGTLVVAFLVLFFALDQALQFMLSQVAWFAPLVLSATMAILGSRLHRLAQGMAARLMPTAKRLRDMDAKERMRAYQERYAMALEDGSLTAKEQAMLRTLALRLGLPPGGAPPTATRMRGAPVTTAT